MIFLLPVVASCGSDEKSSEAAESTASENASEANSEANSSDSSSVDVSKDLGGNLKNSVASSSKDKAAADKNVIMIQLNSLSVPIMSADSGKVTPYLNSLKEEGIYFTNFFNQATDREDIEYSVLNSLLSPFGVDFKTTTSEFNTLADVLKKSGYSASAFSAADDRYPNRAEMLGKYGFDKVSVEGATDADIYATALSQIKSGSGKGFYFISNVDSCYPYIPSGKTETSVKNASFLTNYANASANADNALKAFIEELKKANVYENSVIVIYGSSPIFDYTYEEIEKKCGSFLADGIDTAKAHNVPLFILGLDKSEYTSLATVYDIYPTVLSITGADSKGVLVCGENLFAEADRSKKIFPIQDTLCRGSYISDKVMYLRYTKTSVKCLDRVTGEQYKATDYKDNDDLAKSLANESEYVVKSNYFSKVEKDGEVNALKDTYDKMPSVGKLVLTKENSDNSAPKAKTALMSFSTQFYYAYDVTNGLYGAKVYGRNIILEEGAKEGTYISPAINAGKFEVLYTGWDIVYNGGSAEVYVSVTKADGSATNWLQIATVSKNVLNCTPYEDDNVKVESSRVYMKNGASNGEVRIKIKLIAAEDGASPSLEYFTFTTDSVQVFDSNEADDLDIEKAEFKVEHVQAMEAKQSGAAAIACLLSSTTGKKPDITGVSAGIYDQASDSYTNLNAICEYIHSLKLDAFIDILNYDGVSRVLADNQQVLCYFDDTKSFSIIYGFEGKRKNITYYVYDVLTGKDYKVTAAEYAEKWDGAAVIMNTYVENIIPRTTLGENKFGEDPNRSSIMAISQDRPGTVAEKKYITIHNTGNYDVGGYAINHAVLKLRNNENWTSWHFTVDKTSIYQHIPTDEIAWHASDGAEGPGNVNSIGIEICVNGFPQGAGGEEAQSNYYGAKYEAWEKQFYLTIENAAQLVAQLLVEHDLTMDCIRQHYDFARDKKNCPMQMRYSYETKTFVREGHYWKEFMTLVEIRYNRLLATGDKFDTVNVD